MDRLWIFDNYVIHISKPPLFFILIVQRQFLYKLPLKYLLYSQKYYPIEDNDILEGPTLIQCRSKAVF